MANVYTVLLASDEPPAGATVLVPSPPAGFRYVITDIEANNVGGPSFTALSGFDLHDSAFNEVWRVGLFAIRQVSYHWRGRQVLDGSDHLEVLTGDSFWQFRISGFQLTLP